MKRYSGDYTENHFSSDRYLIGKYTYGVPIVHDWNEGSGLIIGKYTSIAENVTILLGGNHATEWVSMYPFKSIGDGFWDGASAIKEGSDRKTKGDVRIGNDVWIGLNSLILSGVEIGDGAVVAAGSVVTKSIPPYTIVGGNPARVIRSRFSPAQIAALLEIKWWDLEEDKIDSSIALLLSSDIDKFINTYLPSYTPTKQTILTKLMTRIKRRR